MKTHKAMSRALRWLLVLLVASGGAFSAGLLVDLDAGKLAPGKIESWQNAGKLGGMSLSRF